MRNPVPGAQSSGRERASQTITGRHVRICFASLFDAGDAGPAAAAPLLRELPSALAARGHEVTVVHLSSRDALLVIKGATHRFIPSPRLLHRAAAALGGITRRPPSFFEWPRSLPALLRSLNPDVVHVHGTQQHVSLARLRRALPPGASLVVHYHGGSPTRRPGLRSLQRRNLRSAAAVLFTTREQADEFARAGMLSDAAAAETFVETSSDFRWMDRREARSRMGMIGEPVYLSAARLHPVKDPLTVLRGFEIILARQPGARLYHYYLTDELLPELRAFAAQRPALRDAVHFRGRADRDEMERVFNSADILLQASRREFSGCAVLDAMACGVIPVVSDLPSFRAIAGEHGAYFPVGDAGELARRALGAMCAGDPVARSTAVRAYFEHELSFDAMARKLEALYAGVRRSAP